jgi:hypothetical protein
MDLTVRFADAPPYPDALGVFYGQEWAISEHMRAVVDSRLQCPPRYSVVRGEDGQPLPYHQVLLDAGLHAGPASIRGGESCGECGGYVQLGLEPLYLTPPERAEPPLAYLFESPGVIVVREDLASAFVEAKLDVELIPAYFGERQ